MDAIGMIRIACACLACSLLIMKLVKKDYHTAIYWTVVTVYWLVSFSEHFFK